MTTKHEAWSCFVYKMQALLKQHIM